MPVSARVVQGRFERKPQKRLFDLTCHRRAISDNINAPPKHTPLPCP